MATYQQIRSMLAAVFNTLSFTVAIVITVLFSSQANASGQLKLQGSHYQ